MDGLGEGLVQLVELLRRKALVSQLRVVPVVETELLFRFHHFLETVGRARPRLELRQPTSLVALVAQVNGDLAVAVEPGFDAVVGDDDDELLQRLRRLPSF